MVLGAWVDQSPICLLVEKFHWPESWSPASDSQTHTNTNSQVHWILQFTENWRHMYTHHLQNTFWPTLATFLQSLHFRWTRSPGKKVGLCKGIWNDLSSMLSNTCGGPRIGLGTTDLFFCWNYPLKLAASHIYKWETSGWKRWNHFGILWHTLEYQPMSVWLLHLCHDQLPQPFFPHPHHHSFPVPQGQKAIGSWKFRTFTPEYKTILHTLVKNRE